MNAAIVYESHMHTELCGHAVGEVEEYAAVAERRGMAGIIVTCHNPMPVEDFGGRVTRMREDEFPTYLAMVQAAAETWAGRVDIRLGLECDYFPGYESYLKDQLASAPFHHVLGSIHPHFPVWQNRFFGADVATTWVNYFQQVAEAAETGLFDTMSHPDLIKNWFAQQWNPGQVMEEICECLDRVAATGVAMELNTSGMYKPVREMNPGVAILEQMRQRNIPVVVGADAHEPMRTGEGYRRAYTLLHSVGYRSVSQFLDRQRQDIDLDVAEASLKDL
jgi:histidinol-phosphatase (PHP family)